MANSFSFQASSASLDDIAEPSDLELAYEGRAKMVEEYVEKLSEALSLTRKYKEAAETIYRMETEEEGETSLEGDSALLMASIAEQTEENLIGMAHHSEEMANLSVDDFAEMAKLRIQEGVNGTEIDLSLIEHAQKKIDDEIVPGLNKAWEAFSEQVGLRAELALAA